MTEYEMPTYEEHQSYIIIYGNVYEGLRFVGPFNNHDAAMRFVSMDESTWTIVPIELPPEGDEQ